jgi:hypothetical protein
MVCKHGGSETPKSAQRYLPAHQLDAVFGIVFANQKFGHDGFPSDDLISPKCRSSRARVMAFSSGDIFFTASIANSMI